MTPREPQLFEPRPRRSRTGPGLWHRFGQQLAHPAGRAGQLVGWFMTAVNRTPNRLALDALQLAPGDNVLEIGFGPGAALSELARRTTRGRICGLDASPAMLQQAQRRNASILAAGRLSLVCGDIRALPWAAASFQKVLAVNVAYFFDPHGRAATEVRRVLAPGGRAAFYVTDRSTMEKWPFAASDTHVIYSKDSLCSLLEAGGFTRAEIDIQSADLPFGVRGLVAVAHRRH